MAEPLWTVRRIKRWQVPFFRMWYRARHRRRFVSFWGRPLTPSEIVGRFTHDG